MILRFALGFVLTFQFHGVDPAAPRIGTGTRQIPFNLADLEPPKVDEDTILVGRIMLRQQPQRFRLLCGSSTILSEHERPKIGGGSTERMPLNDFRWC